MTRSLGIGGVIKQSVEDFVVEEVLADGSQARVSTETAVERGVIGSSSTGNRFLLCVLVKRDWDTFMAIRNIARQLGICPERIQIAGIKDAKAVTAQHVTIEGVSAEEVENLRLKDIDVRVLGYLRAELSPFFLLGNRFRIKIRRIEHSKAVIMKRVARTVEELEVLGGVPNFFGHQRFGTTRPITHVVGEALVKGSLEKAAMLFLAEASPSEHPLSRLAREEFWATGDFKQALEGFPRQLRYERLMLKRLAEEPGDFVGAFRRLPVKLVKLFVHAYQSYLFNRFLSGRIKRGLSLTVAEVGDYVVSVERSGLPMVRMFKTVGSNNAAEINEAIGKGRMRLAVPLVGYGQHPSHGVQGEIEREILEEEGVSERDFRVAVMPRMSSKGELRAVVSPLRDFMSDMVDDAAVSGDRTLEVDFMLFRGAYATVVLRELMKSRRVVEAGF